MNKELIKKYAAEVYDEIVEYRRYLHAHPEVSMSEGETTKYLASVMEKKFCFLYTESGRPRTYRPNPGRQAGKSPGFPVRY